MHKILIISYLLLAQSLTYGAARGGFGRPLDPEEVLAFRQLNLQSQELKFDQQKEAHRRQEAARRFQQEQQKLEQQERMFQAQQAREKQDREEKARQQAQAQRQREAQAKRQADLEQAADFVYRWAQEKESRWDPFMKTMITKYNNGQGFLPEEISELLHRKTIILQALKIAENDLRIGTYKHDAKIEDGIRKKLARGTTGLEYQKALRVVENEKANEISRKECLRLDKESLLLDLGYRLNQFTSDEIDSMSLEFIKKKYGR